MNTDFPQQKGYRMVGTILMQVSVETDTLTITALVSQSSGCAT